MPRLYCSRRDVNRRLPAGELTGWSRLGEARATSDVIELDGHGLETEDEVTVRAVEGGSLPSPLVDGDLYYALRVSGSAFRLSLLPLGPPLDLTTSSGGFVVQREPPFEDIIEEVSRWADTLLPAHAVPFIGEGDTVYDPQGVLQPANVPALVRGVVADVSAKRLLNIDGKASEAVNAAELAGKAILERFAAGLPMRDVGGVRTNLAINASTRLSKFGDTRLP